MAKERVTDLFLKTEQLLHFRLAFSAVGLFVSVCAGALAGIDFDPYPTIKVIGAIVLYSFIALTIIERGKVRSDRHLLRANAVLIGLDVLALTGLVHVTRGIESDMYILYILPILLSSYTFGRRGIYGTAFLVSLSYVGLLVIESASFLPYLISGKTSGLTAAYSDRLWKRILERSILLVAVAFIWARFCQYMSGVAQQGANRLREQLFANTRLMAELKAQAGRELLINSINSALRSTLDLDQIIATAIDELGKALKAKHCAIVCPSTQSTEMPFICESSDSGNGDRSQSPNYEGPAFDLKLCEFLLEHKSRYELGDDGVTIIKSFLFEEPESHPIFASVQPSLARTHFSSLIVQPMMYGDQSKGVVLIAEKDPERKWTNSELELVKSVAGQVAVAIEHASLLEQLSRRNRDLIQKNVHLDAKHSELRAVQSQLIHQEKMASLGRLVAGIAHELNNPINFVHGNLPYLKEYFQDLKKLIATFDALPDEHKQLVDKEKAKLKYDFVVTDLDNILADLDEGADRIRHIIKNLKSFSRLDEAELKEASIQEGLESTLKILSQYYGKDKVQAVTEFAQIPTVLCYPGQLNQVWMNLLTNAAQATDGMNSGAGQENPVVNIRCELEGNNVLVSITDHGSGIKPEVQSKIFDPFFTTKPVGQGTGLGLSICHSIIERHGGQIWFETEQGKGTTFRVKIPVNAKPTEQARIDRAVAQDPD